MLAASSSAQTSITDWFSRKISYSWGELLNCRKHPHAPLSGGLSRRCGTREHPYAAVHSDDIQEMMH